MTTTPKDSREAFEKEMYAQNFLGQSHFHKCASGQYLDWHVERMFNAWQAATDRLLAMLDDEEMVEAVVNAIEGGAVWFPNNGNSKRTMAQAALSAIKQKLGAV